MTETSSTAAVVEAVAAAGGGSFSLFNEFEFASSLVFQQARANPVSISIANIHLMGLYQHP